VSDREHGETLEAINVAFGFEYLAMAINSARSVRATNPGVRTTVVTNVDADITVLEREFDRVIVVDAPTDSNRTFKTRVIDFVTADRVVFLDCDTIVVGDLSPIFRCLDRFDVAVKVNPEPAFKDFDIADGIPGSTFPSFHSAVLFFRRGPGAERLFAAWSRIVAEDGVSRDQPALARAVFENPDVRVLPLHAMWNTSPLDLRLLAPKPGRRVEPRVIHYRKPDKDPRVAAALLPLVRGLRDALPVGSAHRERADVANLKYEIIGHPLYRWRVTRRPLLAIRIRLDRVRGLAPVDLRDRGAESAGSNYGWREVV
jgi:hypothetical protein